LRRARRGIVATVVALVAGSCAPIPHPALPQSVVQVVHPVEPLPPAAFVFQGAFAQGSLVIGMSPAGSVSLTLDGVAVPLATDGRFVIGFGRDHGPSATIVARRTDGSDVAQVLAISPRVWDIQSLPTLPKGTKPTAAFLARRKGEIAQIVAARAMNLESDGWQQRFLWPVTGRISGVFGSQRIYAGEPGSPHAGVGIARPAGTPVVAPADGVVVLAADAPFTLEGNLLMIDHGMGVNSAFLHLSRIDVKVGQHVRRGEVLGAIGMTGRATGPHLHWAVKWRAEGIDPALLAGAMP
jgi:murein DD-endopeptidase MepM/ murein hydrolase activator NlpD